MRFVWIDFYRIHGNNLHSRLQFEVGFLSYLKFDSTPSVTAALHHSVGAKSKLYAVATAVYNFAPAEAGKHGAKHFSL